MDDHNRVMQLIAMKSQAPLLLEAPAALLVIDMQRDFVHPGYPFGHVLEKLVPGVTEGYFSRVRHSVLSNVRESLAAARDAGLPVVFTGTGTQVAGGGDLCTWLRDFDSLGTQVLGERVWPGTAEDAWQIEDAVAPRSTELVVNKTAADPMGCTAVDQSLRNLGVKTVLVCGLTTDVCVASAARGCADRSYRTIIAADACTTLSPQMHQASLDIFAPAFGQVKTTADIIAAVRQAAAVAV